MKLGQCSASQACRKPGFHSHHCIYTGPGGLGLQSQHQSEANLETLSPAVTVGPGGQHKPFPIPTRLSGWRTEKGFLPVFSSCDSSLAQSWSSNPGCSRACRARILDHRAASPDHLILKATICSYKHRRLFLHNGQTCFLGRLIVPMAT